MVSLDQQTLLTAKLFRGFADPTRLALLKQLRDRPQTVSNLVTQTGYAQSNVSNHLRCLRECDLVTTEHQGKYVVYQLADDRVAQVITLAEALLADVAHGVYDCTRYASTAAHQLQPEAVS